MRRTPSSGLFKNVDASSLAPSPDSMLRYNQNQDRWQAFSASVKSQLLEQLPNFPKNARDIEGSHVLPDGYKLSVLFKTQLMCAYTFLAAKRQEIALELGHGENDSTDRSGWYGSFRDDNFESFEIIRATNEKVWPNQKDQIFKHVQGLIDRAKSVKPTPSIDRFRRNFREPSAEEAEETAAPAEATAEGAEGETAAPAEGEAAPEQK